MKEEKQIVGPGKFVAFSYRMYNEADGKVLFETPEDAPDVMVFGASQEIIPGLVHALEGLGVGDKFEITLPPEAAFGMPSDEYIMTLDADIFKRDGKMAEEVKVGAILPMQTAEGYRVQGIVKEITPKNVVMDFNHPFAGLTVHYEGFVDEVRDATPEEIHPVHGCGGCGGGHCGSEGDSDGCCGGCGSEGDSACSCK